MSIEGLKEWLDTDFWNQGAFLTDLNSQIVILGKGGKNAQIRALLPEEGTTFYLKDFYQNYYLGYRPSEIYHATKSELLEVVQSWEETPFEIKDTSNADDIYKNDFKKLMEAFGKDLKKVVLISREEYDIEDSTQFRKRLFKKAIEFGTGMPYGFWSREEGVIGSSPEILYEVQGEMLKTFALAGTAKAGQEEELMNSAKDRLEHDLVIQDIKEKLSPFVQEFMVGKTTVIPYKSIVHLKTGIEAKLLPDIDYQKLNATLSPTAALGGYPMENSLSFLKESAYAEKYKKRFFGSAFGVMSRDHKQFLVSIRNVQWEKDRFIIESGGGVLPASVMESELEEIHMKRRAIKKHYL